MQHNNSRRLIRQTLEVEATNRQGEFRLKPPFAGAFIAMMLDYRKRIYKNYASAFQDETRVFDTVTSVRWGKAYDYYLRHWLPDARDTPILDCGCGSGKLLHFFLSRGYSEAIGIDLSNEQAALAIQTGAPVLEGNAIDFLAASKEAFELITALDLIEHFDKNEVLRFLDTCHNALKPGGRIILQTPNAESPWGSTHRYNDFSHEVGFNPNALSRLLRLTGFITVEARELGPVPWRYSVRSTCRWLVWCLIRSGLNVYNLAETGSCGSGVFTRIMLVSAVRDKE